MAGHPLPAGNYRKRAQVTLDLETGSGNTIRLGPWEGDISITGALRASYKEPVIIQDRDTYAGAVMGADSYPEISLTVRHKGLLGDASVATIADCITYAGAFAGDAYTDPLGELPSHKATITITAPDGVDVFTAPNSAWQGDYGSGDTNTISLSATCYRPQAGGDPDDAANQPLIRS